MKITTSTVAAGTAALAATVLAAPLLYRPLGDTAKVIGCAVKALTTGVWTDECAQAVQVDIGGVKSIEVDDLSIDFTDPNPSILTLSSSRMVATIIDSPVSGTNWPITHVQERDDGHEIAVFKTPKSAAIASGNQVSSEVLASTLTITAGAEDYFSNFISSMITKPEHTVVLKGGIDVSVALALPIIGLSEKKFDVTNIGFRSNVRLRGFNNFPGLKFVNFVSLTSDTTATPTKFTLTAKGIINNPSHLALNLGELKFKTLDSTGTEVGTTILPNVNLALGDTEVTVVITLTNEAAYQRLLAMGDTYTFVGYEKTSDDPILNKGMSSFKTNVVVPKYDGSV
ncbi:hypothetical protein BGZ51_005391 [Haplosporangium sp. Z 767]|nr:hypothetical protein BGZ51_005391 [Haplosporangium sp. Z 767]KAF9181794.1 hypothetical protein BGZ50_005320 [Haplosporangium sp. Z 11]